VVLDVGGADEGEVALVGMAKMIRLSGFWKM
jgi:hypothetical protein